MVNSDHHCPWVGAKCVGHRTYPAFLHLLLCVTLYAFYLAGVNIEGLSYAFAHPLNLVSPTLISYKDFGAKIARTQDAQTPIHMLFLSFMGVVFGITIGAFFGYHIYLTLYVQLSHPLGSRSL